MAGSALVAELPSVWPADDAVQIAARCRASGPAGGGDWYDVIDVAGGPLVLLIGDAAGHDREAARHRAQLQPLLADLATRSPGSPGRTVRRLDRMMDATGDGGTATLICAELDRPAGVWTLRFASGGHPPPLVLGPDGTTRLLSTDDHTMIGTGLDLPRSDHSAVLQPGDTLLLYTDGLVERRSRPVDVGVAELARLASSLRGASLELLCDTVLTELAADQEDDVCLLAVRLAVTGPR